MSRLTSCDESTLHPSLPELSYDIIIKSAFANSLQVNLLYIVL